MFIHACCKNIVGSARCPQVKNEIYPHLVLFHMFAKFILSLVILSFVALARYWYRGEHLDYLGSVFFKYARLVLCIVLCLWVIGCTLAGSAHGDIVPTQTELIFGVLVVLLFTVAMHGEDVFDVNKSIDFYILLALLGALLAFADYQGMKFGSY